MTQPIIRFEGVSKAFGTQTVLRDFSLDVEPGAFVSIIGRSGCGKTTVLKLVNGLLSPDTGRVLIQGQDVARIDRRAAPAGGYRQGAGRRSGASADGRALRRGGRDYPGPAAG